MKFTTENQNELRGLIADFTLAGEGLAGKMGANLQTVQDFVSNHSLNSIKSYWSEVKKNLEKLGESNPWDEENPTEIRRANNLRQWERFLFLLMGWKKDQEEKGAAAKIIKTKRAELRRLKEEAKTPAERIAEMEAELIALEGTAG